VNKISRYNISDGLRLLACTLALFFVVLAVFDGFEEEEEIEYFGEFVAEAEFDYVDFPESISRPTGNSQVNKLVRIPLVKIFDRIFNLFTSERVFNEKKYSELPQVLSRFNFLITNSVCTNAP
jgi:hypothetical protein